MTFLVGQRIEARFGGGDVFYSGVISAGAGGSFFDILYDDGDEEEGVPEVLVRPYGGATATAAVHITTTNSNNNNDNKRSSFDVGSLVFARYHSEEGYYLAQVSEKAVYDAPSMCFFYSLVYHDGDEEEGIPEAHLRAAPLLGSRVEGRYGGGTDWFPGTIAAFDEESGLYSIHYDDGDREDHVDGATLIRLPSKHSEGAPMGGKVVEEVDNDEEEETAAVAPLDLLGAFRIYALPAVESLVEAVQGVRSFTDDPRNPTIEPGSFDPLEEMLRLVPIAWKHTETLLALAQTYRLPTDKSPSNLRTRALSFIPRVLEIANANLTKDRPSSMHVRALVEVLGAARWTTIDFRESTEEADNGGANRSPPSSPIARVGKVGMPDRGTSPPLLRRAPSTSEMGASGSNAAASFMAAKKESLMFFIGKIRCPMQLAMDSPEGKLDECNRRYCTALIALMDGLADYIRDFQPDGIAWRVLSEAEEARHNSEMAAAKRRYSYSAQSPGPKLSKYQIAAYRKAFNRFDEDGSGEIDFEELTNALQSLGERPSPEMVRNLIDVVDLDSSGQIDFEEFVVMMRTFYTGEAADVNALENLSAAVKSFQSYCDGEGKKRLFMKFLPEDIIVHQIEMAARNDLDTLDWPRTSSQAKLKAAASKGGLTTNKLLSQVSMWDEKVRNEVKKKEEEGAAESQVNYNKRLSSGVNGSRFSPCKAGSESLNTGSPSKGSNGSNDTSAMDASTAHMVMMNPGNDGDRLREALEVLKEERASTSHLAVVEDKAQAKIKFGGLVSGNRFKQNAIKQRKHRFKV